MMDNLEVKIVQLPAMRVASVLGYGPNPEELALAGMAAWAERRGLWQERAAHRLFGFNTSSPSEGSPNYGYEVWLTVGPEVEGEEGVSIKEFPGGLYAVTRCPVNNPWEDIPAAWQRLGAWVETSPYRMGQHQWLEETFYAGGLDFQHFTLDLHLPIL